jgi:O-antigen ligase
MSLANKIAFVLMCMVIVVSTLAYGTVHQPIIAVFYIAVAVMLILWAVDAFSSGATRYSRNLLQVPLYAAALYAAIQIIPFGSIAAIAGVEYIPRTISLAPFATQITAIHFLALALYFSLILVLIDSARRIRLLITLITVFGFGFAFFAILQSVLSPDKIYGIYEAPMAQPFGSFVNRHNFAAYMEMTLALPLGLLFAGAVARDKRLLYVTAVALMGAALLLSGSRGGLVALVAEVILLVMLTTRIHSRKKLVPRLAMSVLLFAAIVAGSIFVGGESSLTRISETATAKDVSTGRQEIWGITLKMIAGGMPLGTGLGAYGVAYSKYDTSSGLARVEQAHNDFLQVISDAGIPGIAIGAFFLFVFYRSAREAVAVENNFRRGIAVGAVAGCFAILVHSIFDFVLHTTAISVLFLSLLALLSACRMSYEDDIQDEFTVKHKKRRNPAPVAPFKTQGQLERSSVT